MTLHIAALLSLLSGMLGPPQVPQCEWPRAAVRSVRWREAPPEDCGALGDGESCAADEEGEGDPAEPEEDADHGCAMPSGPDDGPDAQPDVRGDLSLTARPAADRR
jgi:hypothetical protein